METESNRSAQSGEFREATAVASDPRKSCFFLTNALGEQTGHGTIGVTESDLDRIPFENGPGYVLPYCMELDGRKYVCGILEVPYRDPFWDGGDVGFFSDPEALAYCEFAHAAIAPRLRPDEVLLPIDGAAPARYEVRVALPIESVTNAAETRDRLGTLFGRLAWLEQDPSQAKTQPGPVL